MRQYQKEIEELRRQLEQGGVGQDGSDGEKEGWHFLLALKGYFVRFKRIFWILFYLLFVGKLSVV